MAEIDERITLCGTAIDELQVDARKYLAENVEHRLVRQQMNHLMDMQLRVKTLLPTNLKVRVGSIVNELRSVLDALACGLAARNGESPDRVSFPISADEASFNKDGRAKIRKLAPEHQRIIADLKPWGDANPRLFAFHGLDITRKHRRLALQTASHAGSAPGAGPSGIGVISSGVFRSIGPLTTEWQTIFTGAPGTHIMVYYDTTVAFAEPEAIAGRDIIIGLQWFKAEVASIVERFRARASY